MTFEERIDRLTERQDALLRTLRQRVQRQQPNNQTSEDLLSRNQAEMAHLMEFIGGLEKSTRRE